ncbi:helix-turn-helix domain-containing protein [Arboricoccus pini]|uniref:helix-turn-helix domain-containing protein n=1 Tax=Arboricoccus pini TaxID=1963835 RepID=UPI001FAF0578|nr:helix-turn-helix domain-containing protein [Arboricoccus pini]
MLRPEQCRAARALLNWTQQHLANEARVARATIRDFENARHRLHGSTQALIVAALVGAGVGFLADAHLGIGVYLRLTGHDCA